MIRCAAVPSPKGEGRAARSWWFRSLWWSHRRADGEQATVPQPIRHGEQRCRIRSWLGSARKAARTRGIVDDRTTIGHHGLESFVNF